jgi:CheY-like chemotaxis protein
MDASFPRRYRVLVVDDVEVNRLIAVHLLSRLGIGSVEATNGFDALQAVQIEAFDLILMDVQMPIMNGLSATAAIRHLRIPAANVPIIAFTANGTLADEQRCAGAGMDDFLAKPTTFESFSAKVLKWLPRCPDKT